MSKEREEMEAESNDKKAQNAEALAEAARLLPQARGWFAVAILQDGNPVVMSHLPQYADSICCLEVAKFAIGAHIASDFMPGPTQQA